MYQNITTISKFSDLAIPSFYSYECNTSKINNEPEQTICTIKNNSYDNNVIDNVIDSELIEKLHYLAQFRNNTNNNKQTETKQTNNKREKKSKKPNQKNKKKPKKTKKQKKK